MVVGLSGASGTAGPAGAQGAIGQTGAQGPMAGKSVWSSYRDYTFSANSNEILRSDSNKATDIASYMNKNPSARIGLDGADARRVGVVREALVVAGVPPSKIQSGAFGDPQQRSDGRVAVLISN
jgi:outer membrane protein OmpA-like peptidoglycan-associated protein